MSAKSFSVAVRGKDGVAKLFRVQHEEITDHEQVMAMVKGEIPDAQVVLVGVQ